SADPRPPVVLPSRSRLLQDVAMTRLRLLRRLPASLRRMPRVAEVFRAQLATRAAPSSLNRATGRRRRFAVVDTDLAPIARAAHAQRVTVNDVLLLSIGCALHRLLMTRGEEVDDVVISMPISDRRHASAADLGNFSGVAPICVRTAGDRDARLQDLAAATRAAKLAPPGSSNAVLGPLFRVLALLGLMRWFTTRQRLIHTFVSNLRGPPAPLTLGGHRITRVIPLSLNAGNVTVSFTALSYAGCLTLTVTADPDACPDLAHLTDLLADELRQAASLTPRGSGHRCRDAG
ncbi:MAG: WS/DGAT domain-containing protein, partial [Lapillicoccus sp.]